ncbi:MAG: hypothetical protein JWR03_2939 [Cohnella sp.]|nr:hypothetical protein [Cohnella sp.]
MFAFFFDSLLQENTGFHRMCKRGRKQTNRKSFFIKWETNPDIEVTHWKRNFVLHADRSWKHVKLTGRTEQPVYVAVLCIGATTVLELAHWL